jgi:glyoxylase-like metal-dependent hydrolase (beta-lactamase superfamily II)
VAEQPAAVDLVGQGLAPAVRRPEEARAEELAAGIWRLDLPLPYPPGTVNAYLLEAAEGWVLVDCGSGLAPGWDALEHALGQAGVEAAQVTELVGTHAHLDHVALAAEVAERTGCSFALSGPIEPVIDALREPSLPAEPRREMARRAGIGGRELEWAGWHPGQETLARPHQPDRLLAPEDAIETRSGTWRVFRAPGHAETQVVLLNERSRWLLSADLVYIGRVPYLEYGFAADPFADHLASVALARSLEPTLLLPGHGPPETETADRLDAAAGSLHRAATRVRTAVAERPRTPWEVVHELLQPGHTMQMRQAALTGVLCILERLTASGELVEQADADGVRLFAAAS